MNHYIITRREHVYPFKPYWACICGTRMKTPSMTYDLYREFAAHKEASK